MFLLVYPSFLLLGSLWREYYSVLLRLSFFEWQLLSTKHFGQLCEQFLHCAFLHPSFLFVALHESSLGCYNIPIPKTPLSSSQWYRRIKQSICFEFCSSLFTQVFRYLVPCGGNIIPCFVKTVVLWVTVVVNQTLWTTMWTVFRLRFCASEFAIRSFARIFTRML